MKGRGLLSDIPPVTPYRSRPKLRRQLRLPTRMPMSALLPGVLLHLHGRELFSRLWLQLANLHEDANEPPYLVDSSDRK